MLNQLDSDGNSSPFLKVGSVLIIEDDGLLAMMLEDLVREEGATRVEVCRDPAAALGIAQSERLDCAILDVSIRGGSSYQVADTLAARDIPFLFCTGLSAHDIEERHRHRPLLGKPYSDAQFRACLQATLRG